MKKMLIALAALFTIIVESSAMTYEQARTQALFLTDKMAYELNLTQEQYEAAYEINLDYLMGVATVDDVFGIYWERRNLDLSYILYQWQWDLYRAATYFYRPLFWEAGYWHFRVYTRYPRRDYFYFGRPHFYATYRGGHSWHLNGGRSFYEPRRDHFRPVAHSHRDTHVGMRTMHDRGNYRPGGNGHGSSTRVTAPQHGNPGQPGARPGNQPGGTQNRSGQQGGFGSQRRFGGSSTPTQTTPQQGGRSNNRQVTPSRSGNSGSQATPTRSSGSSRSNSNNNGNFGGNRPVSSRNNAATNSAAQSSRSYSNNAATRSASQSSRSSSSRSGGSSNSHGHFGGRR